MKTVGAALASVLVVAGMTACASGHHDVVRAGPAATATSAADLGGMAALIAAAQQEGQLNVIALPPNWANYGAILKTFGDKYGITVNSVQPDGASQDEITAAVEHRGTSSAPDVFDLGQQVALENIGMFAPYKVATWADIPPRLKDPAGKWVNDYAGFMSIGYDSSTIAPITDVGDLLRPELKGKVALNGDPRKSGAAFSGVVMVALSQGGSPDNIAPGVDFFAKLKQSGNFLPVDPSPATIESGKTPVVIDWNYLNGVQADRLRSWQVMVPNNAAVASYYYQAINADAPHPAAARLWQEFLFSDEGQNLFAVGGVRPVRADHMIAQGTLSRAAFDRLPPIDGPVTILTSAQTKAAAAYLADNWAAVMG